jgi:branched-chain amino acid transport system ATP-binding protein
MSAVLSTEGLAAGYDGHAVVHDLELEVGAGEVVALLGPNGAGKTTSLLTLAGALPPIGGRVKIDGAGTKAPLHRRARQGMALVTEERSVLMGLTVSENLRLGRCDRRAALAQFPELEPLMGRRAGLLSGGEQQMLTLARALARRPRLLLVDELSLGLAPLIVVRLLEAVRHAASADGVAVLLVEQHITQALKIADRGYVLRRGRIVLEDRAGSLAGRIDEIAESYLERTPASDVSRTNQNSPYARRKS